MKKAEQIVIVSLIVAALVITASVMWLFFGQMPEASPDEGAMQRKDVTILDADGNEMITINTVAGIYDSENWAYLEIVLSETVQILSQQEACSEADAREFLFTHGYIIHTAFDRTAYEALTAVKSRWGNACNTASAITDLNGGLLAVFCTDVEGKQINYTQERRSPYSSFKALSVYTPAIEKGVANWSSLYQDAPYKQLEDENGQLRDWPANATETYSRENMTVYEALRKSINTIAVRCLEGVGITESMVFLQTNFGIPLKEEEYVVQTYGEEEVIGNIALGYLETGITPVEMAGYYQVFANGGIYAEPASVKRLCLEDGTEVYARKQSAKQVISKATADLMNKLLQGVVAAGGTGEAVKCYDVEVAGKTGTGDDYADNWFVGVTPGYSLAVWHGQHDTNQAEEMFASVINKLYDALPNANRKFITHQNLHQIAYCVHSGKAFSSACTLIDVGYFTSKDALPVCDACSKQGNGEVAK